MSLPRVNTWTTWCSLCRRKPGVAMTMDETGRLGVVFYCHGVRETMLLDDDGPPPADDMPVREIA